METRHDTTIDVRFDRTEWEDRLHASSNNGPGGKRYVAIVRDLGPSNGRYRKPVVVFDSGNAHGASGVFDKHLDATAYAERWRDAKIAQQERIHDLQVRRGLGLSHRMRELARERGELDREAKKIARQKKDNEDAQTKLVREANDPEVEIDLLPTSDTWRLYDAPSLTDGTIENDHRQLVLEHTGLEPIVPAQVGPKGEKGLRVVPGPTDSSESIEDREEESDRKLPTGVQDANGKRTPIGSWVKLGEGLGPSSHGFLVEIRAPLRGGGYSVTVVPYSYDKEHEEWHREGVPSVRGSHQITKVKKPSGLKRPEWPEEEPEASEPDADSEQPAEEQERPGLDPSKVEWPEDEGGE